MKDLLLQVRVVVETSISFRVVILQNKSKNHLYKGRAVNAVRLLFCPVLTNCIIVI